jgi:manganese transport protein
MMQNPPTRFWEVLRQLGPGMILTGSIVGSGELIAAPTLAARVGFAALWLIVVSCVIKVVIQEELGRYTILTGETTFDALNKIPGPRWRVSWVVWCWLLMFIGVTFQQGGILGGVGQVFHLLFPAVSVRTWVIAVAAASIVILFRGKYRLIEAGCTFMVVSFTVITVTCAVALEWTPYAIRAQDMVEGFRFQIPPGGLAVAFAVFGITGVGATELIYYPYWCLEKGYARFVGPRDDSPAWLERARGWIRIMQTDTLVAMVVYTLATVAFFLLGAGVLHGTQQIPKGYEMVRTLSGIYTSTLGPWAFGLFLAGAFFVLYSTVFSATASNSRVLVDFIELARIIKLPDERARWFWRRVMVAGLIILQTVWYLLMGEPVQMVLIGGIAQACMLPIIAFSTLYLRYKFVEPALRPSIFIDVLLWLCSFLMLGFAGYTLISRLSGK